MAKPDQLFLLIKSMTKAEKRHFKLNMPKFQSGGNKNYIQLFEAIETQNVYNKNAILKKLKGEPYLKHFPVVKKYLHKQILKSLRALYEDESCVIKLHNYLIEIEILYKRGLFIDCAEKIKKAKALAEQFEELPQLLSIIDWEEKVAESTDNLKKLGDLKNANLPLEKSLIDRYTEIAELRHLYLESRHVFQSIGEAKTQQELSLHSTILAHPMIKKGARTFRAEELRLIIICHYAQFKRDYEGIYYGLKQLIQLYESQPHQIKKSINFYLSNLLMLFHTSMTLEKYKDANALLLKLGNIYKQYADKVSFKYKLRLKELELDLLLYQGNIPEAKKLAPGLLTFVETAFQELEPIEKLFLYDLIFNIYFITKDYNSAQNYLQKIIHLPEQDLRMDIHYHARLKYLILQYEQKEYSHLSYVLRSTYRYLLKRKRVYKLETIIINFLKTSITFNSEKQVLNALAGLKDSLLPLLDEPFERNFLIAFPLMEWIESKLQKKDMAEIMSERYLAAVAKEEEGREMKIAV